MWIIRISLDLEGENFSPKKLINELNDEIYVFRSNEPDDMNNRGLNEIYGFGSSAILCPELLITEVFLSFAINLKSFVLK